MERCIKVYPPTLDQKITIEFIPDIYVEVQPINSIEFEDKFKLFEEVVSKLNKHCYRNKLTQIIVIDFDKCIKLYKINLVLFARGVSRLAKAFKDADILSEIQFLHTSSTIKTIYIAFERLIPEEIYELVKLY